MSALGPIAGGGGGSEQATQAIFDHIAEQIQTLRKEMNSRFDRVELLQKTAINLLIQIGDELGKFKTSVDRKLEVPTQAFHNETHN